MNFERAILEYLQQDAGSLLTGGVFFELAPENAAEPFGVLHSVSPGSVPEAETCRPWVQLDVFTQTQTEAVEKAEAVIEAIQFHSGRQGTFYIGSLKAGRAALIQCEDGTWKVPIDIRFYLRRV